MQRSSGTIAPRAARDPIWSRFAYTTSGGEPVATAERNCCRSSSPSLILSSTSPSCSSAYSRREVATSSPPEKPIVERVPDSSASAPYRASASAAPPVPTAHPLNAIAAARPIAGGGPDSAVGDRDGGALVAVGVHVEVDDRDAQLAVHRALGGDGGLVGELARAVGVGV